MVFPYLKGLMVIKKILHIVLVYLLWCFCIQSVFVVIILVDLFRFLTSGIRALSLGRHCGQIFLHIFFSEHKKEGHDILDIFSIFL